MKKILIMLITSILFSSCATILNKKTYDLSFSSDLENANVKIYDSIYSLPNKVKVIRSDEDLSVTLFSDSLALDYKIKASPNSTFLYLNLVGMQASPINYAVDFTNKKRFYYGKKVHLDSKDTLRIIEPPIRKFWTEYFAKKYEKKQGNINLIVSIPYVNGFNFEPENYGTKVNTGFWGISAGAEYFYRNDKYLSLKVVGATDFFVPIPAAVTSGDVREDMSTIYVNFTDNFKFGRLNFGYGLNYSVNNWKYTNETDRDNLIKIKRRNQSFGLTANAYYQFNKYLFVGVVYRPTFWEIKPHSEFEYEHLISLDFMVKIPLKK